MKRKAGERKVEQRMVSEGVEEGSAAPLELSDIVMEQIEAMAKELKKISGGIWALVEGVRRLTEVVEGMEKKEVERVDKEAGTEDVQRADKQTEIEVVEEKEREEEEESEESGSEGEKEGMEKDREDEEKADRDN
jgi:hypothetical protein